jgi:quercetin dioxygenase-like cupin family protein
MIGRGIFALALALAPASSQSDMGQQLRLTPAEIQALPSISAGTGTSGISGIRTRVLAGDPTASGPYTIALSVPADTRIAAHRHRDDRVATVISGTWYFGYGIKADDKFKALPPGSFYTEPGGVSHFARTGAKPVTLYIHGVGPTDTQYEDQAADPRRRSRPPSDKG